MGEGKSRIRFDNFEVDLSSGELLQAGSRIRIQDQPFKVLVLLLEHPQQVVTREELKARIWPEESFGDFDHAVNVAVAKLRSALGDSAEDPKYVETIPRRGYRFKILVPSPQPPSPPSEELVAPSVLARPSNPRSRLGLYSVLAVVALAAIALVGIFLHRKSNEPSATYFQNPQITRITSDGAIGSAALSPDGRYIAFTETRVGKTSLRVRQLSGANSVEIASSASGYQDLVYSPDGNAIFYRQFDQTGQGFIYQIPALGGVPRRVSSDVDSAMTLSPDGKRIAFIRHNPPLEMSQLIIGMTDGSSEKVLVTIKYPVALEFPAWSKDGAHIVCALRKSLLANIFDLVEIDASTGKQRAPLLHDWRGIGQIAWTEHSDDLVFVALDETGSGRGQLFYLPYPNGTPRKITNGVEIYDGVSMSSDSQHLATVVEQRDSHIWVASANDLDHPKQITTGNNSSDGFFGLAYERDGKIVFASRSGGHGTLWLVDPKDGTTQQLIANPGEDFSPFVMADGSILFASSRGGGGVHVWHMDADGANPRELTFGSDDMFPVATPDSRWVFYQSSLNGQSLVMKVPIKGGKPEPVSDLLSAPPEVSADGKLLAYVVATHEGLKLVIQKLDDSSSRRIYSLPPQVISPSDRMIWSRDGKSIQYILDVGGVANIWGQPLSGGPPQQLTHFTSGHIFSFAWSPDFKQLALAKGDIIRDVVTIDQQK